jgi:hypothetical protein
VRIFPRKVPVLKGLQTHGATTTPTCCGLPHFIMQRLMMLGVKERAERTAEVR